MEVTEYTRSEDEIAGVRAIAPLAGSAGRYRTDPAFGSSGGPAASSEGGAVDEPAKGRAGSSRRGSPVRGSIKKGSSAAGGWRSR